MSEREAHHPIDPQFLTRWSPRAFTGEPLDSPTLHSFLEAARWAPSGYNAQPWRFVYALAGTPAWTPLFETLSSTNQSWAHRASALVLVVSQQRWLPPGKSVLEPNHTHAFDSGAAWAFLALQASIAGWHAHSIGGFDRERARAALAIPEDYSPQVVIALGRRGDPSVLPDALKAREQPNSRLPLSALAAEGSFPFD
ncbi:nitroreductase family protein [Roseateles aquatilis]|uniref:Nitroreductase family protein n=1 Tax=Roseateles aquatilis TaxID=431061 RepID=A0A246IWE7_9BURK|nr:nitroreductase family protein [Roseateles aquatilis]OWQ84367.1 nitroreductase family protein [Roseateles aquatilis]